jgi:hypothetical protein
MAGRNFARVKRVVRLEKVDERETSAEWRRLGGVELKIEACNHDGWPDRWYRMDSLGITGFWCEWKAEGKDPEPHQLERHDQLRAQGEIVIVAHSRREFWAEVRKLQAASRL